MKKLKVLKSITIIILAVLIVFCIYNLYAFIRTGNQKIEVITDKEYYSSSNLQAVIGVKDLKKDLSVKSKIKIEILEGNGKKVKGIKEKYKIEEGESAGINLKLPDDIKTGSYFLKVTASSKIGIDKIEVPVSIVNEKDINISVSLDKGIYKPGDSINFRALITSKSQDIPQNIDTNIYIYDGNNNKVYSENTKASDFGIVHGTFTLANEVNSGIYKLVISTQNKEISKSFKVNPYIAPKFKAEISTNKETYLVGETAIVTITANYFFGESVVNADIKGTINQKEFKGITNSEGIYILEHKLEKEGKVSINTEITDISNYLIEESKTITVGTDIFEIEILPENGNIIKGIDNNIYIFTRYADGTPLKTQMEVKINKLIRQVVTDENGIGKLMLTPSDIASLLEGANQYDSIGRYIIVVAEDAEGNSVTSRKEANISSSSSPIINTDKVKYSEGEDITISLNNIIDSTENIIYIYKNKELIKMIQTDEDEVAVNLEDVYGLIDIYTNSNDKKDLYYSNSRSYTGSVTEVTDIAIPYDDYYYGDYSSYSKKTIFIKPNKALNIDIQTSSEEYKPKDMLNIKFTTTDENNNKVDSALLVSILDEAILSLAENDLSIDNIKLSLENIEFVDGITAADVYANIIDDKSETMLVGLLLKQSKQDPNILNDSYSNWSDKEDAKLKTITSGLLILTMIIMYSAVKSKRFGKLAIDFTNVLGIFVLVNILVQNTLYYGIGRGELLSSIAISACISLIIYILFLHKVKESLCKMIIELGLIPLIVIASFKVVENVIYIEPIYMIMIALVPPTILSILVGLSRKKELSKPLKMLEKICKILTKIEIIFIIFALISNIFDVYSEELQLIILVAIYIAYNKIFEKNNVKKIKEGKVTFNLTTSEIIGIIAIIVLVIVVVYTSSQSAPKYYGGINPYSPYGTTTNDGMSLDSVITTQEMGSTYMESESKGSGLDEIFDNATSIFKKSVISQSSEAQGRTGEVVEDIESEVSEGNQIAVVEENIRNVFLESLAFIPELLTQNGVAETEIKISDNITTWNIQTVGNTRNGNIGYNSSSIKVFKEFFIDFELPRNLVVTDKVSIPLTIYNYTDSNLSLNLEVKENSWCKLGTYDRNVSIESKGTKMIYVPLEILLAGSNTLRIEAKAGNISDIVEKTMEVKPNGLEKTTVISSGAMENTISQDIIFNDKNIIKGTESLKVKLYSLPITQAIEGIESIFNMPTGCFEQTSSTLYPNVLALRYLKQNNLDNNEIKEKALSYISSGYQRLLTFEVKGEKGGYSLYGNSPAEPVLTAYGLMQLKDLSDVYDIDENVLENMKEYLYKNQNVNGSFDLGNKAHLGGASSSDNLSLNTYIIWGLSESYPEDERLEKSVEYLENNIDKMKDTYTLALAANVFANTNSSSSKTVVKKLMEKVQVSGETAYLTSQIRDYYGSYGTSQDIQTTALTSIALTKLNSNTKTNNALINYIVSKKDKYGNWYSTQATILALKAIVEYSSNSNISNQEITVSVNGKEEKIKINENELDLYELKFEELNTENNIQIKMKKGKIYYEIIQNYYTDYPEITVDENKIININEQIKQNVKINEIVTQTINIENASGNIITNGMIEINIPQGFSVVEEALMILVHEKLIEKYEYNYGKIYLYIRNFSENNKIEISVQYRANYPAEITGGGIRVYDYYNPNVEGICLPVKITVNE